MFIPFLVRYFSFRIYFFPFSNKTYFLPDFSIYLVVQMLPAELCGNIYDDDVYPESGSSFQAAGSQQVNVTFSKLNLKE